jgi:micrococcal nuclease
MVMNKHTISILFILGVLIYPSLLYAFEGKVVGLSDGDTIKVLKDGEQVKFRLAAIDCPEKKQLEFNYLN